MAGHSKWANIQHRKNAQDAKRGKLFTKLIREITVAARQSGVDPGANPRLRLAIDKALTANMTKEVIDRAIKRGAGGLEGTDMEEIRYEGYGPGGVAILVDTLSDNRNRTAAAIRHAFAKWGGNLSTTGSVAYLFQKKGLLTFAPGADEHQLMTLALENGAEDVRNFQDGSFDVLTSPDDFQAIETVFSQYNLHPAQAEITWLASTEISLTIEEAEKLQALTDMLEELDDVQAIYANNKPLA